MRLGLQLNGFDWGESRDFASKLSRVAVTAEEAGFHAVGVADHLWQHPIMGGPEANEPECYSMLAYFAAVTENVQLMALVSGVHFRAPALLAKCVTTLDVLSGGRAWLGVGSGHYEEEATGLGVPFPPQRERFEMLEETLEICTRMWSGEHGDDEPFMGKHYQLKRALNLPQSLQRPHPPILIAGGGEKQTLRLVARHADACNLRPGPAIPHKLEVLKKHCEAEGRDYEQIEKTCMFGFEVGESGEKARDLVEQLRWLSGMGIQTVIGPVSRVEEITPLEVLGREVIPAVEEF